MIHRLFHALAFLGFTALLAICTPASASHGGPHIANGITVPALMHGQVIPMHNAYDDIMHAASTMSGNAAYAADPRMNDVRTLMTHARYETVFALGRILPGSLTYENIPTHQPGHASLAFAREILVRLHAIADGKNAVITQLYSDVNDAMALQGAGINDCIYSTMTFTTASFYGPDFSRLPHAIADVPLQVKQASVAFLLLLTGIFMFGMSLRRKQNNYVHQLPCAAK